MNITKLSSKGQIVIPVDVRAKFNKGEKFLILHDDNQIILSKTSKVMEKMIDDLEFAKSTEKAYKQI